MTAYIIARVKIDNSEAYKAYAVKSKAAVEAFGGKFIARGGETEVLEGEDDVDRIAMIEFESMQIARAWYESELYQNARSLRTSISSATFTLVEGL